MSRVLLTGVSGVGKSSVVEALRARGVPAVDMDEEGWSFRDAAGNQRWRVERLRDVLAALHARHLFVSGCAEDQVGFYPSFDAIVLLSAPHAVIEHRLATRTTNAYGKRPEERAEALRHLEEVEPLLRARATREIVTTMPLDEVVATVLALADEIAAAR